MLLPIRGTMLIPGVEPLFCRKEAEQEFVEETDAKITVHNFSAKLIDSGLLLRVAATAVTNVVSPVCFFCVLLPYTSS